MRIDIPAMPADQPFGSCDMGGCDKPGGVWVWSQEMNCWLLACAACDPANPNKPAPDPAVNGHRCSCGTWFDTPAPTDVEGR